MMKIGAVVAIAGTAQAWNSGYGQGNNHSSHGDHSTSSYSNGAHGNSYGNQVSHGNSYGNQSKSHGHGHGHGNSYGNNHGSHGNNHGSHGNSYGHGSNGYGQSHYSPTKRSYDAVEYFGDNGKDYGFGENKSKVTVGPNSKSFSTSTSYSSSTFGGDAHGQSGAAVAADILGDIQHGASASKYGRG